MFDFDPQKNYYEILWVSESANQDEIKKAFRKLAVQHHPDKWWNKATFQTVNEAYQLLSDEPKKAQYDNMRKGGYGWGNGGWFGGTDGFDFGGWVDIGDLMWGIFGGGFGWGRKRRAVGEDIQVLLTISLEEAYNSVSKDISYRRQTVDSSLERKTCSNCGWSWAVIETARTVFGVMQVQNICSTCQWSGNQYYKDGKLIQGWLVTTNQSLNVKVLESIKDGVFIKYHGMGHESPDGWAGDLYVKISITMPTGMSRKDDDLYVRADMSMFDLILGGEVTIAHPSGKLICKIPKWTQLTDMIKVWGKGFGTSGIFGKRGDLILIPKVSIPKKLSKSQEKLWKELKESE